MSHVLHYGSSVFEGIRCYATTRGPALYRLREHMRRLLNSAKIYRMEPSVTLDQLCEASIELVRRSGLEQCYLRPIIFRSLDDERPAFGVNPFPNPLLCYIARGTGAKYLGDEAIEQASTVVSSCNRLRRTRCGDGEGRRNSLIRAHQNEAITTPRPKHCARDRGFSRKAPAKTLPRPRGRSSRGAFVFNLPHTRDSSFRFARAGDSGRRHGFSAPRSTSPTSCSSPAPPPK